MIYLQKIVVFNTELCGPIGHFYNQKQLNAPDRKAKINIYKMC